MRHGRPGCALLTIAVSVVLAGCASSKGPAVPRPFPGAPAPPVNQPPVAATPAEPPRATPRPPTDTPRTVPLPPSPAPAPEVAEVPIPETLRAELVATALGLRGAPYRNGGSDPSGFDCSGFVQYVFRQHEMRLPRETREQFGAGRAIALNTVQPGDLVFFQTVSRGPSHVGVVIGGDQFIHAPSSRGVVRIERYTGSYWSSRFVGARRVVDQGAE